MEDTVRRWERSIGELPYSTESVHTTLNSGEDDGGESVRQRTPPRRARRRGRQVGVERRVVARTSRKPLGRASWGTHFRSAEREVKFLVVTELLNDPGVVRQRDDSMNTFSRISPGFVGRNAPSKYLFVQIFVFLVPRTRLFRGSPVTRACLALVREKAERPSDRRAVTCKAEDNGRLLGAVERRKQVSPGVGYH